MRIFLLQHMLGAAYGHWVGETLGWMKATQILRIPLEIFAACDVDPEVVKVTGARGVYELTDEIKMRYGVPGRYATEFDPYCQPMINFMAWSEAFRHACREVQKAGIGPGDLLAIPFARNCELHGTALWLEGLPPERRPFLLFNSHEPPLRWQSGNGRDSVEGDYLFDRYAARRLKSVQPRHRMLMTAADRRLCAILQHAYDLPCRLAPMLLDYREPPQSGRLRSDAALTVSVMGISRREKGGDLIAQVLRTLVRQRPAVRLFAQLRQDEIAGVRQLLAPHISESNLQTHAGPMSRRDYLTRFWQTDLALLPYDRERYAARSSGIFTEAVAYGIPVVVPRNTGMSDHLDAGCGAGETFDQWNAGSIAAAAARALDKIEELKTRAVASSASWRDKQSIHAYLRMVLEWCRKGSRGAAA